jgi:hypothetical protein
MKSTAASLAAFVALCLAAHGVSIVGMVQDGSSSGVAGARVTLFTPELRYFEEERTGADGRFEFQYVAAGNYRLGVAALRYEYQERSVSVSNQVVDVVFTLGPESNGGRWSFVGATTPELLDGSGSGTLLPNGEAFFCHDSRDPIAFEAMTATRWYPANSGSGQGCHMVTLNTSGGLMLVGGSDGGNPQDPVLKMVKTYWRNTNGWVRNPDMFTARWYAGLVRLPDERLLVMGGELADPGYMRTNGCEIYNPRLNSWSLTGSFNLPTEIPPAVVLYTGEVLKTWRYPELFNIGTGQWRAAGNMLQGRVGASFGDHCDHEIVMLEDGRVMAVGVFPLVTNANTRYVEFYNPSNNTWALGPNPRALRNRPEALMLADGRVLSFGGQYSGPTPAPVPLANAGTIPNCTKVADLYDPALNTWRSMADMGRFIHYHNVTVMVPDGRVIATGGAGLTSNRSFAGDDDRIETFEPPYLFRGVRPRIDELSTTDLVQGSNFTMRVSLTDAITKVALIGARATTHWVDGGPQRYLSLNFSQNGSEVVAAVPNDAVRAIPGWYILAVLVDDIPSVGRMVRVTSARPAAPPQLPRISVNVVSATGSESGQMASVDFVRSGSTNAPLTVPFDLDGTAVKGMDYPVISNHVTFVAGTSIVRLGLIPFNDVLSEGTESLRLALTSRAHFTGDTNVVLTIVDKEPAPPALALKIDDRRNGEYAVRVSGPASRIVDLQGSADLQNWQRLGSIWTASGTNQIIEAIRVPERYLFFRARED